MKGLLETAKEKTPVAPSRKLNDGDLELALAWVKNEVSLADVVRAYTEERGGPVNVYSRLARALKAHLRDSKKLK